MGAKHEHVVVCNEGMQLCHYMSFDFLAAWNGMAVEERGSIKNPRVRLCQPDDSIQLEISTRVHTTVYICYFRE